MAQRPETGKMRFGKDWPGVFIRGDDAYGYAGDIRVLLDPNTPSEYRELVAQRVAELGELLASSDVQRINVETRVLKDFDECFVETRGDVSE